jgi:hypothetical protein
MASQMKLWNGKLDDHSTGGLCFILIDSCQLRKKGFVSDEYINTPIKGVISVSNHTPFCRANS